MFDTFTFETSTKKPDPRWQAAHRFARALRSEGFLARRHFIDRIAERGWGSGVRFDPPSYNNVVLNSKLLRATGNSAEQKRKPL